MCSLFSQTLFLYCQKIQGKNCKVKNRRNKKKIDVPNHCKISRHLTFSDPHTGQIVLHSKARSIFITNRDVVSRLRDLLAIMNAWKKYLRFKVHKQYFFFKYLSDVCKKTNSMLPFWISFRKVFCWRHNRNKFVKIQKSYLFSDN